MVGNGNGYWLFVVNDVLDGWLMMIVNDEGYYVGAGS